MPAAVRTPRSKLKAGLSYDFLKALSASLFVDHWSSVEDKVLATDGVTRIVQTIPAFTTANLSVNIGELDLGGIKTHIGLHVENLFDTTYYNAAVQKEEIVKYLQPPRTFRVSADVKF